jgi:trk system potassium uptake protein TrkA
MKIIICGAGQVGFGIAERLAAEDNDVSVIDTAPELIQRVSDALDVNGFVGHGSHPEVLEEAGARDADMIIAVTLHDEINMVACQVAHTLFNVPTTIARVRSQAYLAPHWRDLFSREQMPIDVIISPEIEVGEMVVRRLGLPGAFESVSFGDGLIAFAGVRCEEDCPVLDTPLRQLTELFPDLPAVVAAVIRNGELFVPHGESRLEACDDVFFVARHDQVERTLKIFGHEEKRARRAIIAGGGAIGLYVARRLEETSSRTRLTVIDSNRHRADAIASELRRTVVLQGSSLDEDVLQEAGVESTDALIALTNDDQANILSCAMAKRFGVPHTLCLVNTPGFLPMVRSLGIDAHVSPRMITVSRILQHIRRGRIKSVHAVFNGAGEAIEAEALETSPLVGRPLRDLDLPEGLRIGAILRAGQVIIPNGGTVIEANDRVVIFAVADRVHDVEQMFRVSLEFF